MYTKMKLEINTDTIHGRYKSHARDWIYERTILQTGVLWMYEKADQTVLYVQNQSKYSREGLHIHWNEHPLVYDYNIPYNTCYIVHKRIPAFGKYLGRPR